MCDTIVATSSATKDGVTILAKNSDREPNEAQVLLSLPAVDHRPGETVRCTYIEIPQARHTQAVLLSRPFWMWGAEMGANEHGVAIGNEAVFARIPAGKADALTGMDLVRLGLERAETARAAIDVMTELLVRYGQGGNCGFKQKTYYHNSFIIADPKDAWLLETVNKHWAAKQLDGIYAISNGLTIDGRWDMSTGDLASYAIKKGWCKAESDFNFSTCYSDFLFTKFSDCRARRNRAQTLLMQRRKDIDLPAVISVLRDHGDESAQLRAPDKGIVGCNICMHAGFGPVRISQTTGSMVSYLHPERATHFFTGTAAPCTGIFKPVWTDVPIPDTGPEPGGEYDGSSLFWRHEKLHRATLTDYTHRLSFYRNDRDVLENVFIQNALSLAFEPADQRENFSRKCFESADASEKIWLDRITGERVQKRRRRFYALAWKKFNQQARMPDRDIG